ncbi:hypothetical protein HETIRDRAFT_147630 [Heterobasidion irregulare TC 32-1]|uniref:Uncharacterized protein n=1 Tax=Heterobasidion irregulare (strain TC 32-1) TaxID=747525 RepID=W4K897_HETIT|nr:uncharacterized protein HETIRDRAFT_147630 [Heterobasidion irregulare TC 32-1]ETW81575.1 hypothetical protein HETIRDRAFT_147630 [Heterobasidion irregulare TC 32-1]
MVEAWRHRLPQHFAEGSAVSRGATRLAAHSPGQLGAAAEVVHRAMSGQPGVDRSIEGSDTGRRLG